MNFSVRSFLCFMCACWISPLRIYAHTYHRIFCILVVLLCLTRTSHAQTTTDTTQYTKKCSILPLTKGWVLSASAGTLGYGAGLHKALHKSWCISLGYYRFSYNYTSEISIQEEKVGVTSTIQSSKIPILLSVYPFKGNFHLKAGAAYSTFTTAVTISALSTYNYGNLAFGPDQLGQIKFDLTTATWQPYLGLGMGRNYSDHRFSFVFDLGVFYQGAPVINLQATEAISPTANDNNKAILNKAFSSFTWYPCAMLTFNVKIR
ncbi:MAG: hypothetical protein ACK5HJ_09810 [Bacteroidota bacterium]|jgi:hypothetical protein